MRIVNILVAILGVVGVLIFAAVLFVSHVLSQLGGGGHANVAQNAMKPIQSQMGTLNAQELCNNGDNGYGIDNREPWYDEYYSVDMHLT